MAAVAVLAVMGCIGAAVLFFQAGRYVTGAIFVAALALFLIAADMRR